MCRKNIFIFFLATDMIAKFDPLREKEIYSDGLRWYFSRNIVIGPFGISENERKLKPYFRSWSTNSKIQTS